MTSSETIPASRKTRDEARQQIIYLSGGSRYDVKTSRVLGVTIVHSPYSVKIPSSFIANPAVRHPIIQTCAQIPPFLGSWSVFDKDFHNRIDYVFPTSNPEIVVDSPFGLSGYDTGKGSENEPFYSSRESLLALQLARAMGYVNGLHLTAEEKQRTLDIFRASLARKIENDYYIDDRRMDDVDSLSISRSGLIKLRHFNEEVLRAISLALDSSFCYRGSAFRNRQPRLYDSRNSESNLTTAAELPTEYLDLTKSYREKERMSELQRTIKILLLDCILAPDEEACRKAHSRWAAAQELLDTATANRN